jgi:1-aminocyclopropane-1-carboxylate deaminase/D-cysteine desulfhydrase-like pyridoxal-dependent ACC family enzyme
VQVNENAELESLVNAQAQKTAKLIAAYAILKLEKEIVMAGCWRLSEKQKTLVDKMEQEKAELAKARETELVRVKEELDKETQDYTDYRLNM